MASRGSLRVVAAPQLQHAVGRREWRINMATGSFFDGLDGIYNVLWSIDALTDISLVSYDRGTDVSEFSESCRQRGTSTMLDSARSQLYREVQMLRTYHDEDVRKTAARWCWESFEVIFE